MWSIGQRGSCSSAGSIPARASTWAWGAPWRWAASSTVVTQLIEELASNAIAMASKVNAKPSYAAIVAAREGG